MGFSEVSADVVFVIETTAVNGAYFNDLKSNYIIPTLEHFNEGSVEEKEEILENPFVKYGIVTYRAADCLPHPVCESMGPFSSAFKSLLRIDKLEFLSGKGELNAHLSEGLASALHCFEDLKKIRSRMRLRRSTNSTDNETDNKVERHCIVICNSPPYLMPSIQSDLYFGKNCDQLVAIMKESLINLSICSARKIPELFKLYEKGGGDLSQLQSKNYAKDPRHLVLLKGFSLKEREVSPELIYQSAPPNDPNSQFVYRQNQGMSNQIQNANPQQNINRNQQLPQTPQSPVQSYQQNSNMNWNMANRGTTNTNAPAPAPVSASGPLPPPPRWPINPVQSQQLSQSQSQQLQSQPQLMAQSQQLQSTLPPPQMGSNQQQQQQQSSALLAQLNQPPNNVSMHSGVNQLFNQNMQSAAQQHPVLRMTLHSNQQQQQPLSQPQSQIGIQQSNLPTQMIQQSNQPQSQSQPQQVHQQQQQTLQPQQFPPQFQIAPQRQTIWQGVLEWVEKGKLANDQKIQKQAPCHVSATLKDGEPEIKAEFWPPKLIMQLMPKQLIGNIGNAYLKNSKSVVFHPQNCENLESLTKFMSSGFAGCVHFTNVPCEIKIIILLYATEKRAYIGFIPNDQNSFVDRLRKVIQLQKSTSNLRPAGPQPQQQQQTQQLQFNSGTSTITVPNASGSSQGSNQGQLPGSGSGTGTVTMPGGVQQ